MKTTLALLGVASGTMLAACAGTGASPSSLGASARPMLQNVEWKIEDIGGKGVVDEGHGCSIQVWMRVVAVASGPPASVPTVRLRRPAVETLLPGLQPS